MGTSKYLLTFFLIFLGAANLINADNYQIGVGRADCTGPVAEIIYMGYAKLTQVGCGLHLRQFSRAYIIDDGTTRVLFVTVDAQSMGFGVKRKVLQRLDEVYKGVYTDENVVISGTHTHGAPGGFLMDLLLDISILGFVPETFDSLVDGIFESIVQAHESITEGKIFLSAGEVLDANINRSPASYLENTEEERNKYKYNVDKDLVQLKFVRNSDNVPIGAINWFAVHPTSMNYTNCLTTSDNVGYASILLEKHINNASLPGQGDFVGAFASSNLGDVSPNTKGPICIDSGKECDFVTSTCNNGVQALCIAFGPGENMVESTEIIANKLYEGSLELFHGEDEGIEVSGPVKFIHQYVNVPEEKITTTLVNGTVAEIQACSPAMGYSFAGGTTDGPGDFDFEQGTVTDNPFWDAIRNFIFPPTEEEEACHHPKPILLNTGSVSFPYEWQPKIVSTQILLLGQVALLAVPGELTTMSGRRMRESVRDTIIANGGANDTRIVIAGLSNVYTNYIATPEEYQLQRYEGASTVYGPYTLDVYLNKFNELATAMMNGVSLESGPSPPDFSSQLLSFVLPASVDGVSGNQTYGDCVQQPESSASAGDTISVKFVAGNPRHNRKQGHSYFWVEKQEGTDSWIPIASDASWETRFYWHRTNSRTGESQVTIEWDIKEETEVGTYRISYNGDYKTQANDIVSFDGVTNSFSVI